VPKYRGEFKEKIVQKMMPSNSQSLAQISRDTEGFFKGSPGAYADVN